MTRLKTQISALRYDNGNGFFYVHDVRGTVLVHPLADVIDRKAENDVRTAFVDPGLQIARSGTGAGFFDFAQASPRGEPTPHLGYARLFEPLGWVIGTSRSIGDLRKNAEWREQDTHRIVRRLIAWNVLPLLFLLAIAWRTLRGVPADTEPTPAAPPGVTAAPITPDSADTSGDEADDPGKNDSAATVALTEALRLAREIGAERAAEQVRLLTSIQQTLEKLAGAKENAPAKRHDPKA